MLDILKYYGYLIMLARLCLGKKNLSFERVYYYLFKINVVCLIKMKVLSGSHKVFMENKKPTLLFAVTPTGVGM